MARAKFVKKARKARPEHGIEVGDSYYYWAFMQGGRGGPKHYSKTRPTRSQLTQSDFLSQIYEMEDRGFTAEDPDGLRDERDTLVSDLESLGDEQYDKFSNMPDVLQQGDTGQLLEQRQEACQNIASEFEGIDLDCDVEEGDEEGMQSWIADKVSELESVGWDYE